jgi:hypothetical protein
MGLLEKGENPLKWGEVFQMFKKKTSPWILKIRMISKSSKIFGGQDCIGWQLMQQFSLVQTRSHGSSSTWTWKTDTYSMLRGDPIVSFQAADLAKYYHLEKGTQSLDEELLNKFPHKEKDLFKIWYKPDKYFKLRPSSEYLTTMLRTPYQYIMVMLCRLYGEKDASKFTMSLMPLIYYCVDEGSMFNWDDILSTSLT